MQPITSFFPQFISHLKLEIESTQKIKQFPFLFDQRARKISLLHQMKWYLMKESLRGTFQKYNSRLSKIRSFHTYFELMYNIKQNADAEQKRL